MIKPRMLKHGDTIAIVSLSSGIIGDADYLHKYHIAKKETRRRIWLAGHCYA
ncbi:MAG: hypothetical protein ACK5LC_16150 [Coprobacillaceae bacterium]